jgi:hypothetical protein
MPEIRQPELDAEAIRAKAELCGQEAVATQGREDARYPSMAGFLTAEVRRLAGELRLEAGRRARAESDRRRLEAIEDAANDLIDAMDQARRYGPRRGGPATTAEVSDAEDALRQALEHDD